MENDVDEQEAPGRGAGPGPSFWAEVRDAVAPRAALLVTGVLAIQLLFIASYVGAFHQPTPHRIPIRVSAPAPVLAGIVAKLNSAPGQPLQATAVADPALARAAVRSDQTAGALVVDGPGSTDTLYVASGGGSALAEALQQIAVAAEASQGRRVQVEDLVPLQPGDYRGLTGFYLVVGWIVGGYLVAALLGVAAGSRPATTRRAVIRLLAMVPYAVASGLLGALVVDQGIGALRHHFLALAAVGMLLVAAAGAVTLAFQTLAGVIGIGLTVLVFVVAGNPSAGGAYQAPLLPGLFRFLSGILPNGAGVDAVRRIVYFAGAGVEPRLAVIGAWLLAGVAVTLVASVRHDRHPKRVQMAAG